MPTILFIFTFLIAALEIDDLKAKPMKFKPWATLVLLIIATTISYFVERQKTINEKSEKKTNDSLADVRVKNSNKEILDGIGAAIGKFSLGYDSAKNEISKLNKLIKDSVNRKTTIIESDLPTVMFGKRDGIQMDYHKNDTLKYHLNVCSYSASAIINNAKAYVMISGNSTAEILKDIRFVDSYLLFNNNLSVPSGSCPSQAFELLNEYSNPKSIIILLKATYTDSRGNNTKRIKEVGILNVASNKFTILTTSYSKEVINFITKNHY